MSIRRIGSTESPPLQTPREEPQSDKSDVERSLGDPVSKDLFLQPMESDKFTESENDTPDSTSGGESSKSDALRSDASNGPSSDTSNIGTVITESLPEAHNREHKTTEPNKDWLIEVDGKKTSKKHKKKKNNNENVSEETKTELNTKLNEVQNGTVIQKIESDPINESINRSKNNKSGNRSKKVSFEDETLQELEVETLKIEQEQSQINVNHTIQQEDEDDDDFVSKKQEK
jgi:hypothetical protein